MEEQLGLLSELLMRQAQQHVTERPSEAARNYRRQPYTRQDLLADCRQHEQELLDAIDRYGVPKGMSCLHGRPYRFHPRKAAELGYCHPFARPLWQNHLFAALHHYGIDR